MYKEDTIAAIATPPGEGGVAIVRISGPDAERIARDIFVRKERNGAALDSHKLYYGKIRDPRSEKVLDQVLLTVMRKPHSYTGEDVVEIHCHGGAFVVRQVLQLVLAHGARQAEPGEFTKRGFLNGRMDLAQAEAVLELIQARTDKSAAVALEQMSGGLSKWVNELREELLDILAQVEAAIDFPDEDIELLQASELAQKLSGILEKIVIISNSYEYGRLLREGVRVCLCGRPNVGKSSLLNALLGEERVIVTPVPGTTRDVVEESLNLAGVRVVLWDTAGIRETDDQVEQIGVNLSRRHMQQADAVMLVLDGSTTLTGDDIGLIQSCNGKKILAVINKADMPQIISPESLAHEFDIDQVTVVSAKTGDGLDNLKLTLHDLIFSTAGEPPVIVTNLRHKAALVRSEQALLRAAATLSLGHAPEFIAVDLNEARQGLEEIVGVIDNEAVLDHVFSSFCIGK
ncbi:MAG: tRNA uridine-5-carboxymethylaminomethyl(34) synthesis GTPase MnmE [Deltaproteobacteria bacterium]|nr:tRNA uridine-5-carboxymethylaminomethyl(34) synthesis GTPase MnmE [Deltaproteobacteria bacterium]